MLPVRAILIAAAMSTLPAVARAWGSEGHEIIADIAYAELAPALRARVDAALAADTDALTAHDIVAEATWADRYRSAGHRETAPWHFVDNGMDHQDLRTACFGYPAQGHPASSGPAQDCLVDKITAFRAELSASVTRLNLYTPALHASDNHDRGGNCIAVSLGGFRTVNLHSYWDTGVVQALGADPQVVAGRLEGQNTPAERRAWIGGDERNWALDSYKVACSFAYTLGTPSGCESDRAPIPLSADYQAKAQAAVALQLKKAGVRLAAVLSQALGG